jgi:NAD(P)-dependent dehydrogenase (short-subunit alcohol dehydrogenase family)
MGGRSAFPPICITYQETWLGTFKLIRNRSIAETQIAVAEALAAFGRIDILLICKSEALVGSVEELSQTKRTQTLVRDQFETNFFGPVNVVKAVLPSMRDKRNGHIVAMTGITAHLGTPGFSMYCSSQWALEGYCDVYPPPRLNEKNTG